MDAAQQGSGLLAVAAVTTCCAVAWVLLGTVRLRRPGEEEVFWAHPRTLRLLRWWVGGLWALGVHTGALPDCLHGMCRVLHTAGG